MDDTRVQRTVDLPPVFTLAPDIPHTEAARLLASRARALADALPRDCLDALKREFQDWTKANIDDELLAGWVITARLVPRRSSDG